LTPYLPTEIPGYGDRSAVTMCERLDIKSTKDTLKLKQAKDEVYLKGFYEGVMLVGECAGMKVRIVFFLRLNDFDARCSSPIWVTCALVFSWSSFHPALLI
jgi:hypothetical protein